ncbi:MSMEG_1061 family FMN-dependent PPOX-type flavoprotein [Marinomonas spartinae]|uniref:MSMEG_1061 family FMN-dependent PPOX-type flavoprotein n=1 Tax=Marinomonas spartinae TaxID=1792290 RepID=UPI0018F13A9B|nr:MSMEG_1061 family FMN-dependent PPOX-type flavoprotein [Marinomonas spartinae]MBJ7553650.1 pyridoxamine 5'-phosphate oxidase family protein [Marinomonas spartinae]
MPIQSEVELREIFGHANGRAAQKQLSQLETHSIRFIELSPFMTISTFNQSGKLDCSPRGGVAGFVKILDANRLLIPEAKGNNRLDSLVNIIETGTIGCLFLIPGVDETLRINGKASISTCPDHLACFAEEKNPPKACIDIIIEEVFLHCAKSLMRAKLWSESTKIERSKLPTMGQMIKDQLQLSEEPESQEAMLKRYQPLL